MVKQLKISELKRVVNVEQINKYAIILKNENNNDEKQIETILNELNTKMPSREILLKTRLGFILRDLANRDNLSKNIREKAKQLRLKWKEFHKRILLAPKYDVKCDKPTTENRQNARNSLTNCFLRTNKPKDAGKESNSKISDVVFNPEHEEFTQLISDLEFLIFQYSDSLVNSKYFNTVRKCLKTITDNKDLRNGFLNYEITSKEFLKIAINEQSNMRNSSSDLSEYAQMPSASNSASKLPVDNSVIIDD
jgi:hypothetical protein